jgi:hypothetical protein
MQTLIDPHEVSFPPPPVKAVPEQGQVGSPRPPAVAVASEEELPRASVPGSPDSSGRLRCWCSDDY